MRTRILAIIACLVGVATYAANDKANPYAPIVDRNAFALKDPPPAPVAPPPVEAPPPPASIVKLTGITSILSSVKALIEITEPGPGKTPLKPILSVGEAMGGVEVLFIDVDKGEVRIKNGQIETNLTFAVAELSGPAPGAAPGAIRPGGIPFPTPITTGAVHPPGGTEPTVITGGRNTAGRGSVVLSGGNTAANPTSFGGNMAAGGYDASNPNMPVRPVRTPTGPNARGLTREEAIIQLELQRQLNAGKNMPPLPPTPGLPQ